MYVLLYWRLLIVKKFFPTSAKRECTSELCRRLLKHRLPLPRVSDSLGLGWEPEICMSNRVAGDPNAAGLGLHFENRNLALRLALNTSVPLASARDQFQGHPPKKTKICRCSSPLQKMHSIVGPAYLQILHPQIKRINCMSNKKVKVPNLKELTT